MHSKLLYAERKIKSVHGTIKSKVCVVLKQEFFFQIGSWKALKDLKEKGNYLATLIDLYKGN